MILSTIGLISVYLQKFGQGLRLQMREILPHIHFTMGIYLYVPEILKSIKLQKCSHNSQNHSLYKVWRENYNISCLFSNVWQKYNTKIDCNVTVQSFDNCAFLHDLQVPEIITKIRMQHVHANYVSKASANRPKWKRIKRKCTHIFLN